MSYSIDLCAGWVKIAECPTGVFDGVARNLAAGEWRLTGSVNAVAFTGGHTITDVDTVRVVRDTTIVFPGYVAPVTSGSGGMEIDSTPADGEQFTLSGADAWSVIGSRIAYPTPAVEPPWPDGYDLRTGQASTVAAGYILANAGILATVARRIPGLVVIDGTAGLTGEWSARLQPLEQLVQRVCAEGAITCRLSVDYAGAVTAVLRAPRDRRDTAVVSDQGDLTQIKQVTTPADATYVIAGGQGNLTARTFAVAGAATGSARRERFNDQSSLATLAEVRQAANSKLARSASGLTVQAQITDVAAQHLVYLDDYDLGDTISVEIDQVRYPVVVDAVTVHVEAARSMIRPVLGAKVVNLVTGLIGDVADLQSRFATNIS